ncbi:MAG TPA: glycosyltransferase family 2 protein [Puia sp.]|nr:glycosyltransferase family 2 protein [Puia sp.]
MPLCTIVILTYKGKQHLALLLPTIREAIACYDRKGSIEVLIVDNGSDEHTRNYVQGHFPEFNYVFSPVNDYLFSLNGFIRELESEYMLMLNDDMKLERNILNELIPAIQKNGSLFAVACRIMDFEGNYTVSAVRKARYSRGWLYNYYLDPAESVAKYTLYPGGGAAIFRTAYFNALGGFDDLYRPAYCEDTDLGIRAWQHGWGTVYDPAAVLYHREGGTINDQFRKDKLEQTIFKNQLLCMVKNTHIPGFLPWFYLMLPYRILRSFFTNRNLFMAWKLAVKQLPDALARRKRTKHAANDLSWIQLLDKPYLEGNH